MIILKSCGSPSWGGIEIYILRTIKELQSLGHDVSLLCLPNTNLHKNAEERNIRTLPILSRGAGRVPAVNKLRKYLNESPVDVVHTHLSNDLWILVNALNLSGSEAKLILSKCMASGVSKKDLFHRVLYNRVDKIVAVSNFIKENVIRTCPVDAEKVEVIHDAIQLDEFKPAQFDRLKSRKELGFAEQDIVIGMIGRMSPGKGHEIFFESVNQIKVSVPDKPVKFMIVGGASFGEEKYEARLMALAEEKGITKDIKFCGFQSNIPYYLSAIDILAFPSNEESFGGTVLEAMAMHLPVVASNSGGVPDTVADNDTGFLVERNNPAALTESLIKLIEDGELRYKMGMSGRLRVERYFEMKSNMKIFERLYEKQQQ